MGLTRAAKYYFMLAVLAAGGCFYAYDVAVNGKKILRCVNPDLTITLNQQRYTIPRKYITSIKPVSGETVWRPKLAKKSLPCKAEPVVHHAALFFYKKHSFFIDLKDPFALTDAQKRGTYGFFDAQKHKDKNPVSLPDGTKRYSMDKKDNLGEKLFYILPASLQQDAYGKPLAVSCYVREYKSLQKSDKSWFDERCRVQFLGTNDVFVDFDFVKKGKDFDLPRHVQNHLDALKSFEK